MAQLRSASSTIEITPYKQEVPKGNWIDTLVALEYHVEDKQVRIELPSEKTSLMIEDFNRLFDDTREYIEKLPIAPIRSSSDYSSSYFTPMEGGFTFDFAYGYYSDNTRQDGVMYVKFDMRLATFNIMHDKIGCSVRVKIQTLLDFLGDLQQELNRLLASDNI